MKSTIYRFGVLGICFIAALTILTSCGGGSGSHSNNPPAGSDQVQDVKASVMEYTDQIRLHWSLLLEQQPDSYEISRFTSKSATEAEVTATTIANTYFDKPSQANTPYYYRITWIDKDKREHGTTGPLVFGLYCNPKDPWEPNDTQSKAVPIASGSSYTANTFVFDDQFTDTDWYKYQNGNENVVLRITLGTIVAPFIDKLTLQFYNQDNPLGTTQTLHTGSECDYPVDANATVYFKIEPVLTLGNVGIGSYSFTVQ